MPSRCWWTSVWVLWPAEIRSAVELTGQQRQDLAGDLGRLAGVEGSSAFHGGSNLIGGVMARIGSKVYDGSVRGQLAALRNKLAVTT